MSAYNRKVMSARRFIFDRFNDCSGPCAVLETLQKIGFLVPFYGHSIRIRSNLIFFIVTGAVRGIRVVPWFRPVVFFFVHVHKRRSKARNWMEKGDWSLQEPLAWTEEWDAPLSAPSPNIPILAIQ